MIINRKYSKGATGTFLYATGILLVLNLLSGAEILMTRCVGMMPYYIFAASSLLALVEALPVWMASAWMRPRAGRIAARIYLYTLMVLYVCLIAFQYFMQFKFSSSVNTNTLDAIFGTTSAEASNFFTSYMTFGTWAALIGGIMVVVSMCVLVGSVFRRGGGTSLVVSLLILLNGAGYFGYAAVMYVRYHHADSIQDYTGPTRIAYLLWKQHKDRQQTVLLREGARSVEAAVTREPDFDIVFVLGESYSRHRCQLYGYDKPTAPFLSSLVADSSLTVYTDAVSPFDWTNKVLTAMWGTAPAGAPIASGTLFPAAFRKAGYRTALLDNEFVVNGSGFFFCDAVLSDLMYDTRNRKAQTYDMALVDSLRHFDTPGLYIVHLIGQHFSYSDRFPEDCVHFTADMYDDAYSQTQRRIMADYDNATLYNDHVLQALIGRFADRPAVLIYVSDHGEEVFELRDYFGHGNAPTSPDPRLQLEVPMMIWTSDSFRSTHPDLVDKIHAAADKPVIISDLPHALFDLAGIATADYDPTRSFLNEAYLPGTRTVLHTIDYDTLR